MSCRRPTGPLGPDHLRREGSRYVLPADRAAAAARGCAQRADRAPRRRWLWRVERLRRSLLDTDGGATGRKRLEVQPLPHDRAVLADAPGLVDGSQPPLRRDGRDHGDRHVSARLQLDPAEHGRAAGRDPQAQRLLHCAVRQCDEVPVWETSPLGPFVCGRAAAAGSSTSTASSGAKPTRSAAALYDGTVPIEPDRSPEEGYHVTEDMTDRAIDWVRQQKALMPDKPFFAYFAPGATHAPYYVPTQWSDKYKGHFDMGWDALREESFARQKELGVIPARGRADRPARRDPCVGRHAGRPQAGARAPDGGVRGLSSTPTITSAGSWTRSRTWKSLTTR